MSEDQDALPGRTDALSGAVVACVGVYVLYESLSYGWFAEAGQMGPGFVPGVSGAFMLGLGLIIALHGLRRGIARQGGLRGGRHPTRTTEHTSTPTDSAHTEQSAGNESQHLRRALVVLGLVLVAIFLARWIGLLPALGSLVFVLAALIEREGVVRSAVYAITLSVAAWLVFGWFLNVPLPTGIIG